MECNNDLAQELLSMPKLIVDNNEIKEKFLMCFGEGQIFRRCYMCSEDRKWNFMLQVKQKKFQATSISIHFQEKDNVIQLFRIDYNAPNHKNPKFASEYVPKILLPYVGKEISSNHVHIFVQNDKPLAWAIPLEDYEFPVKTLSTISDLCYALEEFFRVINLQTDCKFEGRFIL